jgi:acetylornithine/N-succinyldiaminopimelate aminotransferase
LREGLSEGEARFVMQTYRRADVEFVRGAGSFLYDDNGKEYLDFLSGIAVTGLGHAHPELLEAAATQAGRLGHVSNLFYTEPMVELAERLSVGSIGGPVFFCNSGAEANECAIKVARKHAHERGVEHPEIITFEGGFHGRTYGALSASPKMAAAASLGPMLPGFRAVAFDDPTALEAAFTERTAAVMLEVIQGESGVFPFSDETLARARELTAEAGALLIVDEVQTGVGRTGSLWAFQQTPVRPDVLTTAKALGGGFPIGACIAADSLGQVLSAGDHGSTFAGGPVGAAVAARVLDLVDRPEMLRWIREAGRDLSQSLTSIAGVEAVRGKGLMIGVQLRDGLEAGRIQADLLARGLVTNAPRPDTLRLLPPYTVTADQISLASGMIAEALSAAE